MLNYIFLGLLIVIILYVMTTNNGRPRDTSENKKGDPRINLQDDGGKAKP